MPGRMGWDHIPCQAALTLGPRARRNQGISWDVFVVPSGSGKLYPLVMTNSSPWKMMAHRNRWFTY